MKDDELLQIYVPLVPFLAELCGPTSEVLLFDVRDPEHSVIAASQAEHISGRGIGSPMTDYALQAQKEELHIQQDYLSNYLGKKDTDRFKSSTFFIKNEGRLVGLLSINRSMQASQQFESALKNLMEGYNLAPVETPSEELTDTPVSTILYEMVSKAVRESGVDPKRMSKAERVELVHKLNEQGVLSMRGAAEEIASQLFISKPTLYRYLNQAETL